MLAKSDDIAKQILSALSIPPDEAYRVIIDLTCDAPVRIYVLRYGTKEALCLNWNEIIENGEVIKLCGSDDEED